MTVFTVREMGRWIIAKRQPATLNYVMGTVVVANVYLVPQGWAIRMRLPAIKAQDQRYAYLEQAKEAVILLVEAWFNAITRNGQP